MKTWSEARSWCMDKGGMLANLNDAGAWDVVTSATELKKELWTGLGNSDGVECAGDACQGLLIW